MGDAPSIDLSAPAYAPLLDSLGVPLTDAVKKHMALFLSVLKDWNQRVNLISYQSDDDLALSHLLDSLMVFRVEALQEAGTLSCLDVGPGGGFPGVPLALARPDWSVHFLEAVQKKQTFLENVLDRLAISHGKAHWGRAEEWGRDFQHREKFDAVFARAVGPLATTLELTLPFARPGGRLVLHRGADGREDAQAHEGTIRLLGGALRETINYQLPGKNKERHLIHIVKEKGTPMDYPRRSGVPAKKPLQAPS